jgi:hypothetical protein
LRFEVLGESVSDADLLVLRRDNVRDTTSFIEFKLYSIKVIINASNMIIKISIEKYAIKAGLTNSRISSGIDCFGCGIFEPNVLTRIHPATIRPVPIQSYLDIIVPKNKLDNTMLNIRPNDPRGAKTIGLINPREITLPNI